MTSRSLVPHFALANPLRAWSLLPWLNLLNLGSNASYMSSKPWTVLYGAD
jgi:hypothetical protein